jgi:chromosome transmission fidelity protein 1
LKRFERLERPERPHQWHQTPTIISGAEPGFVLPRHDATVGGMATQADQTPDLELELSLDKLNFNHPFTPYDVQETFMRTVYDVLEAGDGQIGILESPTGTVSGFSLLSIGLDVKCY